MFLRKRHIAMVIVAFCILFSTGCQYIYTEGQVPSERAPLYFYIAVDNSLSYGLPKPGQSISNRQSPQKVFDDAKGALYRQLIEQGLFQEGDRIVGISPFTDERVGAIQNYLPGGPLEILSDNSGSLTRLLLDTFDKLKLRPAQRVDYRTYYRNVLDQARTEFENLKATSSQQVCILLTDERGGEVEGAPELEPEKYPSYYVIKLEAKAVGNGTLAITPNDKLAEFAKQKTNVAGYVAAIREEYKRTTLLSVNQLSWMRVGLVILCVCILAVAWFFIAKSLGRDWLGRGQAPSLSASFHSGKNRIYLDAQRFQLPQGLGKYRLTPGGDIKNLNARDGWIEAVEPLPPGQYEISIRPDEGEPIQASFKVVPALKGTPSLKVSYKASEHMLFLMPQNFYLPEDKDRYDIDEEGIEIETLNVDGRKIVFNRSLRAGRHTLTIHLDGEELPFVKAPFEADAPPPSLRYAIAVAELRNLGNPKVVELTGREINLLEKGGFKTSLLVWRDDTQLYIRPSGNVQKEDGTNIFGTLTIALSTVIDEPLFLALQDDRKDIEITVQQL
jgi:hypothetical protein